MADLNGGAGQTDLLQIEIANLRRENRRMKLFFTSGMILLCLLMAMQSLLNPKSTIAATDKDGMMRVRGLIVEDAHGTERLRLGAPLPDPMGEDGIRHPRKGPISGMIISDAKGTERGGYVTDDQYDEAFFTLDSRKGQEVLFLANPGGGTNLDLFDRSGNEAQLMVFPSGPKLVLKKAKQVVAELPAK